jgi:hypothetical protein
LWRIRVAAIKNFAPTTQKFGLEILALRSSSRIFVNHIPSQQHGNTNFGRLTMAMNTDRRRINAPSGGTSAPVFARTVKESGYVQSLRPTRTRGPDELRKICMFISIKKEQPS